MSAIAGGFGLNFYGYFLFAALWVSAYFIWARHVNAREKREHQRGPQKRSSAERRGSD